MKMYLNIILVSSILIIYLIKLQHSVVQSPWIQLEKYQSKTGTEIVCNSSQFQSGTINFYESGKLVVEIWNNGSSCRLQPEKLHGNLKCGCRGEAITACNITVEPSKPSCQKWRCGAVKDDVLTYSDIVDVCGHVSSTRSATTHSPSTTDAYEYMNCTSTNTVNWIADSYHDLFEIRKYYRNNISVLIDSFKREDDGSIVTCKIEEPSEEEWVISIFYPVELCDRETSIPVENITFDKTCQYRHGNPNITVKVDMVSICPFQTAMSTSKIDITLCELVKRDDFGARQIVGNATGLFKVEILYPATILQYDITIEDIRSHAWNLTSDGMRYIRFNCHGDGNPPPVMTLIKDETVIWTKNTLLQHKIHLDTNIMSGIYMCIASNELGSDNKSINVNPQSVVSDFRGEKFAAINNIVIYVVSGVVALTLVCLFIHFVLKRLSCYKPLQSTENGSLAMEMVTIETSEQPALAIHATEDRPSVRMESIHIYESIPTSPIADISFSDIIIDDGIHTDVLANREVQVGADSGRYEILDRNARDDVPPYLNLLI